MNINRLENETLFEWKLRLCKAKLNHEIDLDWQEIVDLLNLDIHPDSLRKMSYGYVEYDDYIHNGAGASERILAISDMHIPFNLPVTVLKDYSGIVDTIVVNGDLLDNFSASSFPKKMKVPMDEELILGRQYLIDLIEMIKPKKIMFTKGNHENRLERYLTDRLSEEIVGILPVDPLDSIINTGFIANDYRHKTKTEYSSLREVFENVEIVYDGNYWIKEGNVLFAHPIAYSSGMLKTTEKAVNYFLRLDRTFNALVLGHTHKCGSFAQGGIKMYEQGCLCDLNQLDYSNGKLVIPNQNGFMYICLDDDGNIIDSKTKLITL